MAKKYVMPFKYWQDKFTVEIGEEFPEHADPLAHHKALLRTSYGEVYKMQKQARGYMKRDGPFKPTFYKADCLEDYYLGLDCFILAPGPSLEEYDLSLFSNKLTIGLNSTGFHLNPFYWLIAENEYIKWLATYVLDNSGLPYKATFIMSGRVAAVWRNWLKGRLKTVQRSVYITQLEEKRTVPPRVPAPSMTLALAMAWWMGCKRAIIIGMDLSRPENKAYVGKVPHTEEGAENSFKDQILTFRQIKFPGLQIFNASPYSKAFKLGFTPITKTRVLEALTNAPNVTYPMGEKL